MQRSDHFEALWDAELLTWVVSNGDGCYANGFIETEARTLADALNQALHALAPSATFDRLLEVAIPRSVTHEHHRLR